MRTHVEDGICLTRHRSSVDNLGDRLENRLEFFWSDGTAAIQFDVRFDADTFRRGVNLDGEATNRSRLYEPINSTLDSARRKPNNIANVRVPGASIVA
jgi:hypothetical protein